MENTTAALARDTDEMLAALRTDNPNAEGAPLDPA